MKVPERRNSLDVARTLDNALRAGVGRRLHSWQLTQEGQNAILAAIEKKKLTKETLQKHAGLLCVTSDKAAPNYTAAMFLQYHTNVTTIWLWDPAAHGLWNLTKLTVQEAGFFGIMYHTQMLVNWRAAFGESIKDIARAVCLERA